MALINTCLGRSLDSKVEAFTKQSGASDNLVVLTTSGDDKWMPKVSSDIDAMACASRHEDPDRAANAFIAGIEARL